MNEHPTAALRRMHRWRMATSGLVILIAGITLGAAGAVLVVRPARDRDRSPLDPGMAAQLQSRRMQEELSLTAEQVDKIREILHTRFQALEKIRTDARPLIDAQLEGMKKDIDKVLTAEQRDNWKKITERFDRVFHRGMPPGGRGGPGPRGRGDGFRGDRQFGPGDRRDANDVRRPGGRRSGRSYDPNDPRRLQGRRGDPNGPPGRGGPRPDWLGPDDGRRRFDRGPDANDRMADPNLRDRPMEPLDMPLGFGSLWPGLFE